MIDEKKMRIKNIKKRNNEKTYNITNPRILGGELEISCLVSKREREITGRRRNHIEKKKNVDCSLEFLIYLLWPISPRRHRRRLSAGLRNDFSFLLVSRLCINSLIFVAIKAREMGEGGAGEEGLKLRYKMMWNKERRMMNKYRG